MSDRRVLELVRKIDELIELLERERELTDLKLMEIQIKIARLKAKQQALSLTLAELRGVGERVFHTMPDMARNFDAVSAGP
jgi:hypothetical protein